MRLNRTATLTAFILLAAIAQAQTQPMTTTNDPAYLFTSFRGDGDGLHLAYSTDGLEWIDLRKSFLTPTVGSKLMRDPQISRGPDGLYRMVWTSGWNDTGIGYATSANLVDWSEQKYLPLMANVPGTKTCWAPEVYYDEAAGEFAIVWSSDVPVDGKQRLRAYVATTKDFATISEPRVLFDPGFDNLDTTILRAADGKYHLVFKQADRPNKIWGGMWHATSDKLLGPYTVDAKPMIENKQIEGPALVASGDGRVLLYADYYADKRYGVFETRDWTAWTDVTNTTAVVEGQRHGSILDVPPALLSELRKDEAALVASVPAPILGGFTADPSIRVFGDTYYVYPTTDRPHWNTTEFVVWSSKNLIDWKREGVALDVTKDLKWANSRAWAPDCIERNGKYYFYFCADTKIGVAVADKPTGPFVDALGKPLIQKGGKVTVGQAIDPNVFVDGDGQAYLYYGNPRCQVVKLKQDMVTVDGDPVDVKLDEFREGVWVFKRNGKYYFTWSIDDARSLDYRVGWGTSDSPLGPVTSPAENFIVLKKNGNAVGTAHHSVLNVPGTDRWYICYHRHAVPGGSGYKRQVCLARLEFDAAGNLRPVDPLSVPFPPGDDGELLTNGRGRADR